MNNGRSGATANRARSFLNTRKCRGFTRPVWILIACAAATLLSCQSQPKLSSGKVDNEARVENYMILDDFSGHKSSLGTSWEGFSDRVMGGVSDLQSRIASEGDIHYLAMSGHVSTRNNGGFIQVRLKVGSDFAPFNGSRFHGVRLVARGSGSGYYLHARTAGMVLPWKYYAAAIPLSPNWTSVEIPWLALEAGDFGKMGKFRPSLLKSLAIVAAKGDFDARIEVREIGFY
jgi:hypothetical protein